MSSPIKFLISFVGIVLFLVGIIWLASPSEKSQTASLQPQLSVNAALAAEESFFDFGDISMSDGNVEHIFRVSNKGADLVNIAKLYTSCMCTKAIISASSGRKGPFGMPGHGFVPSADVVLNPGETAEVEVIYDPAAHGPSGIGRIERSVYLEGDAGSLVELRIRATVTP